MFDGDRYGGPSSYVPSGTYEEERGMEPIYRLHIKQRRDRWTLEVSAESGYGASHTWESVCRAKSPTKPRISQVDAWLAQRGFVRTSAFKVLTGAQEIRAVLSRQEVAA